MSSVAYVTPVIARRLRTLLEDAAILEDTFAHVVGQLARISPVERLRLIGNFARWRREAESIVALIGRRDLVDHRGRSVPLATVELTLGLMEDELAQAGSRAQTG